MQEIKSKVKYPCTDCDFNGTRGCQGLACIRWNEWFKGGACKSAVNNAKAYLAGGRND